ncbi:MAG: hypothetical protein OER77_08415, partial [Myxococcales bacterium]|nr:hypothetical protein [Myxococcales bacterium]
MRKLGLLAVLAIGLGACGGAASTDDPRGGGGSGASGGIAGSGGSAGMAGAGGIGGQGGIDGTGGGGGAAGVGGAGGVGGAAGVGGAGGMSPPMNPCEPNPCLNFGVCETEFDEDANTYSEAVCVCSEGFSGGQCESGPPTQLFACEPNASGGAFSRVTTTELY